jgi:hypothetical protein
MIYTIVNIKKSLLIRLLSEGGISMFLFLFGLFIGSLAGMMLMAMLVSARNQDDMKCKT